MQLTKEDIKKIKELRSEWLKLREISAIIGCNINTVARYCLPYEPVGRKEHQRRYVEKKKALSLLNKNESNL